MNERKNINDILPESEELRELLIAPQDGEELEIPLLLISDIMYRIFYSEGVVSLRHFADVIRVHSDILDQILSQMQDEHLVEIVEADIIGRISYAYRLTDRGLERGRGALERGQYIGPAPVTVEAYTRAIELQTAQQRDVTPEKMQEALHHLVLPEGHPRRIGPAVQSGTSLFLYGPAGNGKTSAASAIAEMMTKELSPIWLPYALNVGGRIIQLYDEMYHERYLEPGTLKEWDHDRVLDRRWDLFCRPAVMTGGELKMEALELRYDPTAKFYDAPVQLKANGGMLLIDDFGRQQMSAQSLINRWIVPLESSVDYLRLQTGQTLSIPFRQLIVFSTNLQPEELVDAAFLRRIQVKVEFPRPDEKMFYRIFTEACETYDIPFEKEGFVYLLRNWYQEPGRKLRAVHARDILKGIKAIAGYQGLEAQLSPELIDEACSNYFVRGMN